MYVPVYVYMIITREYIYVYICIYIIDIRGIENPPNSGISNNICDSICIYITYISIHKMYIWGCVCIFTRGYT